MRTVHYESVPRLISHGSNARYSARPWASKLPYMLVHVPQTYVDNSGTTLHRFTPGWPAARSPKLRTGIYCGRAGLFAPLCDLLRGAAGPELA